MSARQALEALGAALSGVPGLRVHDYLPDNFLPPAAAVGLPTWDFVELPGPCWALVRVPVYVAVPRTHDRQGQTDLVEHVEAVIGAVESFDGYSTRVLRAAPTSVSASAEAQYPAYQIDVEIIV